MRTAANLQQPADSHLANPLFDPDGFMVKSTEWSREMASQIAKEEGLYPLTMNHWRTINYVRKRFLQFEQPPLLRRMCRDTGLDRFEVKELFGSCLAMWRIAGLPNPGDEARSYMS